MKAATPRVDLALEHDDGPQSVWNCPGCGRYVSDRTHRDHADCYQQIFDDQLADLHADSYR